MFGPIRILFYQNDVSRTLGVVPTDIEVEDFNMGIAQHPKLIKISKKLPKEARREYLALLSKYSKVFAWKFEDLKVYDTFVI